MNKKEKLTKKLELLKIIIDKNEPSEKKNRSTKK